MIKAKTTLINNRWEISFKEKIQLKKNEVLTFKLGKKGKPISFKIKKI